MNVNPNDSFAVADGTPVCPQCGSVLVVVTRYVGALERKVLRVARDENDTGPPLWIADEDFVSDDLVEVLTENVHCSRLECVYFVPENEIGDIVMLPRNTTH